MNIVFIRHGMTEGNKEKRYIGKIDEELCADGRQSLIDNINSCKDFYPKADIIFSSPMKRCIQTSEIIYPDKKCIIVDEFREIDFGDFEGKNYKELNGNYEYQKWIDSGGKITFPNGESRVDFSLRCKKGFIRSLSICEEYIQKQSDRFVKREAGFMAAFVVHGGTIMSIMEYFEKERLDYYSYRCDNGHGFICEVMYNENNSSYVSNNITLIKKGQV